MFNKRTISNVKVNETLGNCELKSRSQKNIRVLSFSKFLLLHWGKLKPALDVAHCSFENKFAQEVLDCNKYNPTVSLLTTQQKVFLCATGSTKLQIHIQRLPGTKGSNPLKPLKPPWRGQSRDEGTYESQDGRMMHVSPS